MAKPLKIRLTDGPDLSDELVLELWALRRRYVSLARTESEDEAYFRKFVSADDSIVASFHGSDGKLGGFFTIAQRPVDHAGRRGILLYSKYFYFDKAYRGHYKTLIAPWLILPRVFRRHGLRHLYFVTTAFPQSYVSLARSTGNVRALHDAKTTPWERQALHEFAGHYFGRDWQFERGVVINQNVADSESLARSEEAQALTANFERLNPQWRQGQSLPIIFPVDWTTISHSIKRTLRRAAR
ncbi:hypothetical protein [Litorivivens sp.]|uniref:hypothetical protein n=1 Tax=Litorivivens sp. TaxID=2020868 RepID=UPI003563C023